ncbi:hypothetical protein PITC_006410 [Penicillium italicum]|uniref:Uncharacterized protein n=1 Tax=Penicillium italicum TaxID=40296 RepID=A0A0A2LA86_PENIT|nr:hypothetical protein PITC_006410 [Penicillium italicum]
MSDLTKYTVGWICAITTEYTAAKQFLDETHDNPEALSAHDHNAHTLGKIGKHNVVIAVLPDGEYGLSSAARVAESMLHSFPNVRIGLMVGIGGGAPSSKHDIRLGDVVVSSPRDGKGGVFQYDFGKTIQGRAFRPTGFLNQPPLPLRAAVSDLKSHYESEGHLFEEKINDILKKKPRLRKGYKRPSPESDRLYQSTFTHKVDEESCAANCGDDPLNLVQRQERTEDEDNPMIHYGLIASANNLMKDASIRDKLAAEMDVLCFEMEAAGLMNHFPCLVIRGICDYADSHKNKEWQGYAAMTAASYAQDLLRRLPRSRVEGERKIVDILSDVDASISKAGLSIATMSSRMMRKEDIETLDWLTKIDYGPLHSDYLKRRQPETGKWLLESTEYQDWRNTDKKTLFCPGIPGAGKTILASIVIEDLTAQCLTDHTDGLAYVYFNFQRKDEQKAEDLLASILKQLAQSQSSLPQSVKSLYKHHETRRTRPSLDELSICIQSMTATYTRVFLVIDALDECQKSDDCRYVFLSRLFDLQRKGHFKILATSRHIPEISERFIGDRVEVRAHASDVKKYLDGRILRAGSELLVMHKEEIIKRITESVDGMFVGSWIFSATGKKTDLCTRFLLAQLHFDSIKKKMTLKQVKNSLSGIRTGVEAYTHAYDDAMDRIKQQGVDASKLAMDVLQWITGAKRQLRTQELQHALAVEHGKPELDEEDIPLVKDMASVCAGLVTIDEESGIIRLVHFTTQDYFEKKQNSYFPKMEPKLAMTCITYLSFCVPASNSLRTMELFRLDLKLGQSHPFYEYAASYWLLHARETEAETNEFTLYFLENEAKISVLANGRSFRFRPGRRRPFSRHRNRYLTSGEYVPSQVTSLYRAACYGMEEAARSLIEFHESLDAKNSDGRTPLSWSAQNGYESIVEQLVEMRVDL